MPESICLQIPPDDVLESQDGWQDLGNKTFAAIRALLVVVKSRESGIQKGPPVKVLEIPGGAEYTIQQKNARIVKRAGEIQNSIQETVTFKVAHEVSQKITSEVGATGVVPTSKLSTEITAKSGVELTDAVQRNLALKRSFEIQDSEEITRSVSFKPSSDGKNRQSIVLQFYLGLWPWRWDFYLYRVDYLRLRHERHLIWPDIRKTIYKTSVEPKQALFRVRPFEPQDEYSFVEGSYVPDVTADDEVTAESFVGKLPSIHCPSSRTLEDLARIAFPVTRQEKKYVKIKRRAAKKVVKKAAKKAAKPAAKKAAKKAGFRKAAPHRAIKTARNVAVKKSAVKRAAAKKGGPTKRRR